MVNESTQVAVSLSQQDVTNLGLLAFGGVVLLILLANVIFNFFFVLSVRKTLKMIPQKHHAFPMVLLWLTIVPGIGYIFEWIMLPFGVPRTIESFFANSNSTGPKPHSRFFGLGLAAVIVELGFVNPPFGLVSWILKVIYWSYAVSLRHEIQAHLKEFPESS